MFISPIEPAKWFDRTFFCKKLVYLKIFPELCSVYLKTRTTMQRSYYHLLQIKSASDCSDLL